MSDLKPSDIVRELDRYIVGQGRAKRAVAIALRNRWRRRQVPEPMREEIAPKNIILIGPTGVGKTEIARRLSRLTDSPFTKVEASKFTEVGYVGRDVESMVRDLLEITVTDLRTREQEGVREKSWQNAEERMLDLLLPKSGDRYPLRAEEGIELVPENGEEASSTRKKLRAMLRDGKLDNRMVDLDVADRSLPFLDLFPQGGMEELGVNFREMLGGLLPRSTKKRKVRVAEAMPLLAQEEAQGMVDMDRVVREAVAKVEESGIIFLDEIDKIAGTAGGHGPQVSREGVQRDLLPVVEGTTVTTKYGPVRTDHILFIAAGAFQTVKPADLIPELQGRFPIRVELDALTKEDFRRILTEPRNALTLQYQALLATEGVKLSFTPDGVERIADLAVSVNSRMENIGARRLHTLMERLLEEILFDAPGLGGTSLSVDASYVEERLRDVAADEDLSRYIL